MIRVLIAADLSEVVMSMERIIQTAEDIMLACIATTLPMVQEYILEIEDDVVLVNDYPHPRSSVTATTRLHEIAITAATVTISRPHLLTLESDSAMMLAIGCCQVRGSHSREVCRAVVGV